MKLLKLPLFSFLLFCGSIAVAEEAVLEKEEDVNLYAVEVRDVSISTGSSATYRSRGMNKASKQGFETLLQRLTPRVLWNRHASLTEVANLDNMVEKFSIIEEVREPVYSLNVGITYNRKQVLDFLTRQNIPYSESSYGKVLIFPVFETPSNLQLWGSGNIWRQALFGMLQNDAFEHFEMPTGTSEEKVLLTAEMANFGAKDVLLNIAGNYGASSAVVLRAQLGPQTAGGRALSVQGQWYGKEAVERIVVDSFFREGESLEKVLQNVARYALNKLAENWRSARLIRVDRPDRVFLRFAPVDAADLEKLKKMIKPLSVVRKLTLRVLNVEDSVFQVDFFGSMEALYKALGQAGLEVAQTDAQMVWEVAFPKPKEEPLEFEVPLEMNPFEGDATEGVIQGGPVGGGSSLESPHQAESF